jgi:hypothetical protein
MDGQREEEVAQSLLQMHSLSNEESNMKTPATPTTPPRPNATVQKTVDRTPTKFNLKNVKRKADDALEL